jgi:hypothetical protein
MTGICISGVDLSDCSCTVLTSSSSSSTSSSRGAWLAQAV